MARLRTIVSNVTVWFTLLVACAFIVPFIIYWDRDQTFELMNAIVFACACGTAVGHFPAFWYAMRLPYREVSAGELLNVGIFVGSLGATTVFGARWLWRIADRPWWATDHAAVAFGLWVFVIGYMLCFSTVGAQNGRMPAGAYQKAALTVFLAALTSTVLVTLLKK